MLTRLPLTQSSPTISRRTVLQGAIALAPALALARFASPVSAQGLDPAATVQRFYAAVATYQYAEAYAMLGSTLQSRRSEQVFTDGYDDTAFVQVETGDVGVATGHTVVPVTITAWHNDRTIHAYGGSYTLTQVGNAWIIDSADIKELAAPANVAPLMRFSDVSVSLGPGSAATGHRYFSLLFTNSTSANITAGGVPHLTVVDAQGKTVLDSEPEYAESIAGFTLGPSETAEAAFEWSNWCGDPPTTPLQLSIDLPGDPESSTVAFAAAQGPAEAPPCMGDAEPTTFSVKPLGPVRE